jgi:hypothetical protein
MGGWRGAMVAEGERTICGAHNGTSAGPAGGLAMLIDQVILASPTARFQRGWWRVRCVDLA